MLQLAEQYNMSASTIRRRLNTYRYEFCQNIENKRVIVLIDTTYWGRNFGVIVFKDSCSKKILWRKYIERKKTVANYLEGIKYLKDNGLIIEGIVCDGLYGLIKKLSQYSVQLCVFHQYKIAERYLTLRLAYRTRTTDWKGSLPT
ncbi:MAG: hypothetical protein LBM08_05475 [Dysgonamonadaceae bacterium]|nr:hypothetical protein [Dysgonamonadaceae bacterium]